MSNEINGRSTADRETLRTLRRQLLDDAAAGRLVLPNDIKRMRHAIGMTQAAFAKRFRLTVPQLIDLEKGRGNPQIHTINRIAAVFGLRAGLVPIGASHNEHDRRPAIPDRASGRQTGD